MKQVSLKKLFLNKVTVASLESSQLNQVKGGTIIASCQCTNESLCYCPEPPEGLDPHIPCPIRATIKCD